MPRWRSNRAIALTAVATLALTGGVYAVASSPGSSEPAAERPSARERRDAPPPELTAAGARLLPGPLLVRAVDPVDARRDGPLYELSPGGEARRVGARQGKRVLACARVHASPDGGALCVRVSANAFHYELLALDGDYRPVGRRLIDGVPSRVRVSRDGRYGAFTAFDAEGQGYFADTSEFSTETQIVDMRTGRALLRLANLRIVRDGKRRRARGELWGVTFGDGGRYFATLARGKRQMLIAGRVGSRTARVVGDRFECPSLSPDGSRIAYKRRIGDTNRWRLHVRDLDSGADVALAETRSIDDQPEWLGDDLVAYSDGEAVYAAPADGSGRARPIARQATSPAWLGHSAP